MGHTGIDKHDICCLDVAADRDWSCANFNARVEHRRQSRNRLRRGWSGGSRVGLLIRKRRKGRNGDPSSYAGKAELSGEGVHRELNGEGAVYEKSTFVKPVEIDNDNPVELDGDWRGWEVGSPQRHLTVSERNI